MKKTYVYIIRPKGKPPVSTNGFTSLTCLLRAAYRIAAEQIECPIELAAAKEQIKDAINGVREHLAEDARLRKLASPGMPLSRDYAYVKAWRAKKKAEKQQKENQQ